MIVLKINLNLEYLRIEIIQILSSNLEEILWNLPFLRLFLINTQLSTLCDTFFNYPKVKAEPKKRETKCCHCFLYSQAPIPFIWNFSIAKANKERRDGSFSLPFRRGKRKYLLITGIISMKTRMNLFSGTQRHPTK